MPVRSPGLISGIRRQTYNYHHQTGTIEDIYQGYILTYYLSLSAGSAELVEQQDQKVSDGFSYRKSLIMLFASLNIGYERLASSMIASQIITNNLQQQVMLPYSNTTGSWDAGGTVSKYVFFLRTTFSTSYQWQNVRAVLLQNNQLLPSIPS